MVFRMLREHRIPMDFCVWEFKGTQSLLFALSKQGADRPRGHAFHSGQDLLRKQEEGSGVMRDTNDQGTLLYSFLLKCYFSVLADHF